MKVKSLIMIIASLALMMASGCKKEEKPGQLESIKFKQASYTIAENYLDFNLRKELETVPAGVKDIAKIKYVISDESVATMNSSYLEPKRDGDITVTATIQGKSATCNVQITAVPIEDFSLEDFSVQVNGTAKALLTTVPSGISHERFAWKLSNTSYATIDQSGVVTGLKEGTVTVTATAGDKSKTCTLTIEKVSVDNITLSKSSIEFTEIGSTEQLTATITPPEAAYHKITWKSSNTSVATVVDGLVTCKGYGKAVITATADSKTAECNVNSYETVKDCQGNFYRVVKIGSQKWMAENLKCTKYDSNSERAGVTLTTSESSTYAPYYTDNGIYGYLYNYAAAVGFATAEEAEKKEGEFSKPRQGICPDGWHLPSDAEWSTLAEAIGGTYDSNNRKYPNVGDKLKTKTGWSTNTGTDYYSFSALPAGQAYGSNIMNVEYRTYFWTSSSVKTAIPSLETIYYSLLSLNGDLQKFWEVRSVALSVRCVKN